MRQLYILLIIFLFLSCGKEKSYKYKINIYTIINKQIGDTKKMEKETIKALNDSIAYFKAVQNFVITRIIYDKTNKENIEKGTPIFFSLFDFELIDNKGNDISKMNFSNKEAIQRNALNFFNLKDSMLYYDILKDLKK